MLAVLLQYWKRVWSQNRRWCEVKCGHLVGDWVSFRPLQVKGRMWPFSILLCHVIWRCCHVTWQAEGVESGADLGGTPGVLLRGDTQNIQGGGGGEAGGRKFYPLAY